MILPAVVLGAGLGTILLRQMRSAMIASLGSDYVRTARAKGLHERDVVLGHALRNSLVTVVTVLGLELGALISGSVVTESIFLIPGFGRHDHRGDLDPRLSAHPGGRPGQRRRLHRDQPDRGPALLGAQPQDRRGGRVRDDR